MIGNFETAKGRLPGDCNSDGLIGFYLNSGAFGHTANASLRAATFGTTSANQTARALLYSNTGAATTVGSGTAGNEFHCPATGGLAAQEANANLWVNELRANNHIGVNTVPRLFAKHIGEDSLYVGAWSDAYTLEFYNAILLVNVPAPMAQRLMKNINGSDSATDMGQIRVVENVEASGYIDNAFDRTGCNAVTVCGSVVNLVYFFRNQPRLR